MNIIQPSWEHLLQEINTERSNGYEHQEKHPIGGNLGGQDCIFYMGSHRYISIGHPVKNRS